MVGDEIRVIAPSKSMSILDNDIVLLAKNKLEKLGFVVTFGKNVYKTQKYYDCATIEDRIEDLHEAFKDRNVKAILTAVGGYNLNQLLPYIDYELIKNNPKILCGLSDITALQNAIYTKTNLVTFSGVHFINFGMKYGFELSLSCFKELFLNDKTNILLPVSKVFSSDKWYDCQDNRKFYSNDGLVSINKGVASGTIIGGNLCTLNLLQGTDYMPVIKNSILFLEDTANLSSEYMLDFDRNFNSLLQSIDINELKGIVIGRSELESNMSYEKWEMIINNNLMLKNIPVIINADFGHTTPSFIFPIGGNCEIESSNNSKIRVLYKNSFH